jgi:eukaryotic-like serine/threonine-protein kinase
MDNNPPPTESRQLYQYWAFISYSSKDRAWAKWLHTALENYRLPSQLIKDPTPTGEAAPNQLKPMFWDRAEMTAFHDLGELIERSLRDSRFLIVVCSPNAVQSPWVEKEIEIFRSIHGSERILSVIVDGQPGSNNSNNCFPVPLRNPDPKAPDARKQGDGKTNAKLMLLATMLGVRFDVLKRRDQERRLRLLGYSLVMALTLLICMSWLVYETMIARNKEEEQRVKAEEANLIAQKAKTSAEGLITSMLFDLKEKLEPLGRSDVLDDVSREAEKYYQSQEDTLLKAKDLKLLAKVYQSRADVVRVTGNSTDARSFAEKAVATFQQLVDDAPSDANVLSHFSGGLLQLSSIEKDLGQIEKAHENMGKAVKILEKLTEEQPEDTNLKSTLAKALSDKSQLAMMRGDLEAALDAEERSISINEELASLGAAGHKVYRNLGSSFFSLSEIQRRQGDNLAAQASHEKAFRIFEKLATDDPADALLKREFATSLLKAGDIAAERDDFKTAREAFEKAYAMDKALYDADPADGGLAGNVAFSLGKMGAVASLSGDLKSAEKSYQEVVEIFTNLTKLDPSNATHKSNLSSSLVELGDIMRKQDDLQNARKSYADAHEIAKRLVTLDETNLSAQNLLSVCLIRIGEMAREVGNLADAKVSYTNAVAIFQLMLKNSPTDLQMIKNLIVACSKAESIATDSGDPAAARMYGDLCLKNFNQLANAEPDDLGIQQNFSKLLAEQCDLRLKERDYRGVLELSDIQKQHAEQVLPRFREDPYLVYSLGQACGSKALAMIELGSKSSLVRLVLEEGIRGLESFAKDFELDSNGLTKLSELKEAIKRLE